MLAGIKDKVKTLEFELNQIETDTPDILKRGCVKSKIMQPFSFLNFQSKVLFQTNIFSFPGYLL